MALKTSKPTSWHDISRLRPPMCTVSGSEKPFHHCQEVLTRTMKCWKLISGLMEPRGYNRTVTARRTEVAIPHTKRTRFLLNVECFNCRRRRSVAHSDQDLLVSPGEGCRKLQHLSSRLDKVNRAIQQLRASSSIIVSHCRHSQIQIR